MQDPPRSTPPMESAGSPVLTGRVEPKELIPTTVNLLEASLTAAEADKLGVKDWNDIIHAVRVMCQSQMPSPKDGPVLHRVPSPGDALNGTRAHTLTVGPGFQH
jgi:hypothetical protein